MEPGGSIVGLVLFNMFINDLKEGVNNTLMTFEDKLGVVNLRERRVIIQRDLAGLETGEGNTIRFSRKTNTSGTK